MNFEDRFSRQIILEEIGEEGQARLSKGSAAVIGCGALGGVIANNLARAGVGEIRIADRDLVEYNNLHRQTLFSEKDVGRPKAVVAKEKLEVINSEITIKSFVEDVNYNTILKIIQNCDVVVDATDNLETRFLINDACIKHGIPWVYGGAIKTEGMCMTILPGETACLRCMIPELPKAGTMPTCATVGVLNTIPPIIASMESTEALKILMGKPVSRNLRMYDVWNDKYESVEIKRNTNCDCCGKRNFEYLNADKKEMVTPLCGANVVQINPIQQGHLNLEELAGKLGKLGNVEIGDGVLKFKTGEYGLDIFKNGRAIIHGTEDVSVARSLYSKFLGV